MMILFFINLIGILLLIGVIAYKKNYRLLSRSGWKSLKDGKLLNNKYFSWTNPYKVINEAKKANWQIDNRTYWLLVIAGSIITIILLYFFFQLFTIMPLGILGGFAVPNVLLFYKKRKNRDKELEEIGRYISSMANMVSTFNDVYRALKETMDLIEEPIKGDVEKVLLKLENGISSVSAFDEFNDKYENPQLKMFNDNLSMVDHYGGKMDDVLFSISKDYDEALANRRKIRLSKFPKRQSFYITVGFLTAIPIAFMIFSYEYYTNFVHSYAGKCIFMFAIATGILSSIQMERIYDREYIFTKKG